MKRLAMVGGVVGVVVTVAIWFLPDALYLCDGKKWYWPCW